ncbi:hypothetical protein [Gordonibacter sp. 28C]|uniref:hypothetical protein n=1 Tax=Gordonibacter sp. 28C TaxID=2078569 RepID=UPI0011C065FD|nr:hypothetical protein [Gordonibacter sp. 28C]
METERIFRRSDQPAITLALGDGAPTNNHVLKGKKEQMFHVKHSAGVFAVSEVEQPCSTLLRIFAAEGGPLLMKQCRCKQYNYQTSNIYRFADGSFRASAAGFIDGLFEKARR